MAESERTRIDPNTADVETLCRLPGVGQAMAQRIVDARPFDSVEDLTRVRGVSTNVLQRMSSLLSLMPTQTEPELAEVEGEPEGLALAADWVEDEMGTPETLAGLDLVEEENMASEILVDIDLVEEEIVAPETLAGVDLVEEEGVAPETLAGVDLVEEEDVAPETLSGVDLVEAKVVLPAASDEAESDESEAVSSAEPPTASPEPPEPAISAVGPARQDTITRSRLLWTAVIGGLFALVLSLVLSLGILANLNGGTLNFALPSELAGLAVRVEGLEAQADDLSQDVNGLRTRLSNLEALSGRVGTLEEAAQQLRTDVDATAAKVSDLSAQASDLTGDVADLTQQTDNLEAELETVQDQNAQFQAFLGGLRDLMATLFQPEGGTP
jgi:outer membrane murein-binding lipoprotein Lpp